MATGAGTEEPAEARGSSGAEDVDGAVTFRPGVVRTVTTVLGGLVMGIFSVLASDVPGYIRAIGIAFLVVTPLAAISSIRGRVEVR